MRSKGFLATLLAVAMIGLGLLAANEAQADGSKRVALVIGNSDYTALAQLANPVSDADAIAATLRGIGFEVMEGTNLTASDFARSLVKFRKLADDADVALVYYSGHGLQFEGQNYLVGVDATLDFDASLRFQAISLSDVVNATGGAATALVYVDACRSFPTGSTFLANSNERGLLAKGSAPVDLGDRQARNTLVGFACSVGQTAEDGAGHNSPFARAMVQYLSQPNLSVTDMFTAVTDMVVASTAGQQKPEFFTNISTDVPLVAAQTVTPGSGAGQSAEDNDETNTEERAFADAREVGTAGAYRAFMLRFPSGFYAELAREETAKLAAQGEAESPESSADVTSEPPPEPAVVEGGRRVALIVGNADYDDYGHLANPLHDADDVSAALRKLGFQTIEAPNVNARTFARKLSDFSTLADNADVALFYYSGHALQYQSENYMIPVDAILDNKFALGQTIRLDDVLAATANAHASLIFLDACRTFPIAGTFLADQHNRIAAVQGLAAVDAPTSDTFIGFAARAGTSALDGDGRNSPFTSAMLKYLPTPGLEVPSLFTRVTGEVIRETKGAQKPQSYSGLSESLMLADASVSP